MGRVTIKDKTFKLYITNDSIEESVKVCGEKINQKFEGSGYTPVIVSLLNGAAFFTVDLCKHLSFMCSVDFVKYSTYQGTQSLGEKRELIGFKKSLKGEHVIIVDDIVDSGFTMASIVKDIEEQEPASITVVAFIHKPNAVKSDVKVDFSAIEMFDNPFIVGYGLDYDEHGRTLKDIYILED